MYICTFYAVAYDELNCLTYRISYLKDINWRNWQELFKISNPVILRSKDTKLIIVNTSTYGSTGRC